MKKFILFFIFLIEVIFSWAQAPMFQWAKGIGGIYHDYGLSMCTDVLGNSYVAGTFGGTVDFDPGIGVFNLTSAGGSDIFISKLDTAGSLVWAKRIGGTLNDWVSSIRLDSNGDVYTTGWFNGTSDFDPDPGIFNLVAIGSQDLFISKITALGNFIWAKRIGSPGSGYNYSNSINIDALGNVYITGSFSGTMDFDPNAGSYNLSAINMQDIFILKLDPSGNFIWVKKLDGINSGMGHAISFDVFGNVYVTGYFISTVDFDPGPGTFILNGLSGYIFILKLDFQGNFIWAKNMGAEIGKSMALDSFGNIYVTGYFAGTVDFDPDIGVFNLTSSGQNDIFVLKLNFQGAFIWARSMGWAADDRGYSLTLDSIGNVYATGHFNGTIDFDSGFGVSCLSSSGGVDIFILKLNSSGDFVWAENLGGTDNDYGEAIFLDSQKNVYVTGYFHATADFNPGPPLFNLTSKGESDIFIFKLSQCAPILNVNSVSNYSCNFTTATLTATGANNYLWNNGATTNSIVVSPTVTTTYTVIGINPNECFNTQTISITVNICTGTASSPLEKELVLSGVEGGDEAAHIFPNPNNGSFEMELNSNSQIIITNALGQIILDEKRTAGKQFINFQNEANGIYFLKIITERQQQNLKLVKE